MRPSPIDLQALLAQQFGHESFRPGQERIIRDLLNGRDVLAVLPTGAGKSLVYQLAAQLLPGVTLVVSPLIALMKDQAESLEAHGVDAGVINSSRTAAQSQNDLHKVERAEARLLYVTPERFEDHAFMAELEHVKVSLLAIDEAHCLSEWGYDFRPSYLALAGAAERLGRPTLLALTATATPWVRRDIIERLGLRNPDVVVRSVDRPNLLFEVRRVQSEEEDHRVLRQLLVTERESDTADAVTVQPAGMRSLLAREDEAYPPELRRELSDAMSGSGIIYCATTHAAEETAGWLREWGIAADYYHGRRRKTERDRVQDAFMAGELRVIAATNAFGLGVDKPDVRFVLHRDIPGSVEEYYQEAGRAGRDGRLARCTLIYRPGDLGRAAFLSAGSQLSPEDVIHFHDALAAEGKASLPELARAAGLGKSKAARLLALLQREGLVEEREAQIVMKEPDFDPAQVSMDSERAHHAYQRSRLQMMRQYAELWDCRRSYLLNYFGQEADAPRCGLCDNDWREADSSRARIEAAETVNPAFAAGDRVRHVRWGEGQIIAVSPGALTVQFQHGEEKLSADLVREEHLLERVGPSPEAAPRTQRPTAGANGGPVIQNSRAWPAKIGRRVAHELFGEGEVERVTADSITVLFDRVGYKTLAADALEMGEPRRQGGAER